MELDVFKKDLDNRKFWRVNSKEVSEAANKWSEEVNSKSNNICKWSWDCGLKLDYDGDICNISSRFYPPHKNSEEYGKYSGTISVYVCEEEVHKKDVEADSLDELQNIVETYVLEIEQKLITNLKSIL